MANELKTINPMIKLKRAYEPARKEDGYRVLVDRLWPRGIKKSNFPIDEWAKDLAPSSKLRKTFGHDPDQWQEFRAKYRMELRAKEHKEKINDLAKRARMNEVTLIYSANNDHQNNAVVLKEVLERLLEKSSPKSEYSRKAA